MIYGDWIGRWARAYPGKEAVYDAITGRRHTYGQMAGDIHKLANFLGNELGIGKGDMVTCLSLNRYEYIVLFFALSRLGAVMVPLNFRLALGEFRYFFEDARPKALFYDAEHSATAAKLQEAGLTRHFVCFDSGAAAGRSLADVWGGLCVDPPPEVEIGPEDPQLIIYTSGTTGNPKGVILTHGMISANALNTNLAWDLRSDDRTILHAAMFYTAGWNVFTLPLFQCRASNILVQSFEPDQILDLIHNEDVTLFFGVPTMYQMMLYSPKFDQTDFGKLRFAVSGGAALGPDILRAYQERKGLRIWEGYGLTEVGPNDFMANGKPGSLGCPTPLTDVKLIDLQGNPVGPGQEGEILMRGPGVCAGYHNKPEITADTIKDGWFHTGDLGRVDEDGHYYIAGRLKDMIISGGANIYPAEIEHVVVEHPAVAAVAVIGVPDAKWGEVPKAIVELKAGEGLGFDEMSAFLADRLGRFKQPKYMAVVDELPRTAASGKVQKFILKQQHGGADNN